MLFGAIDPPLPEKQGDTLRLKVDASRKMLVEQPLGDLLANGLGRHRGHNQTDGFGNFGTHGAMIVEFQEQKPKTVRTMNTWLKTTLIATPFIEVLLLAQMINRIGFLPTLGLVIVTASLGLSIIRLRGLTALQHLQAGAARGELPGEALSRDALSSLGGVLLVIPGPLTDLAGLLLQIPDLQSHIGKKWIKKLFSGAGFAATGRATILEGEFHREDGRPLPGDSTQRRPQNPGDST